MGQIDSLLLPIELPNCLQLLWGAFLELNSTRASGMGVSAITFLEIKAWCDLNRIQFNSWELSTIKAMDAAVINVWLSSKPEVKAN